MDKELIRLLEWLYCNDCKIEAKVNIYVNTPITKKNNYADKKEKSEYAKTGREEME